MATQAMATSPTVGGGLGKWEPDPEVKGQWLASDGAKRPPARILVRSQVWIGKEDAIHYVYRNSEYLGSRLDMKSAQALARSGQRTESALKDVGAGDAPAFLQLTKKERRASRDAYVETRYDDNNKLIPKKKQEEYMAKYDTMNPEQLVAAYNLLVETARAMGLDSFRSVARFKDKDDALKYIAAVESSIRARQSSEKTAKQQEGRKITGPVATEVSPQPKAKEEPTMTTKKTAKKVAAPKKTAKTAKKVAAKKVAAAPGPKVYERPAGKKGEFTAKLGTRPGTNRDKLALFLFDNLGKMVGADKITKAVYGKADANGLTNVVNGLKLDIEAAKVSYHIKREGGEIGLYAGSGK